MTDKQIIIDGIDVTGCEYCSRYADTTIYHCDLIGECKEHPNCYYKQLKLAEQRIVELNKTIKAKEQECERLKKIANNALDKVNNYLDKKEKSLLYKQTLTEIKEIAEKIDDSDGCAYGDYDCNNCSSLEQETVCTYKVKKLILQIISECEVE
jgi:hypothetical protein